jgi:hypothetical protein
MVTITPKHLARGAYVYVQSTADQLLNNPASRLLLRPDNTSAVARLGVRHRHDLGLRAAHKPGLASNILLAAYTGLTPDRDSAEGLYRRARSP